MAPRTDPAYWRGKRYSEDVVHAVNAAIDMVKLSSGASRVSLAGFSGGGALAVLVAARRDDVVALRTVAGNLALDVFCGAHDISPLEGSLDPLTVASALKDIPQRHFIGSRDRVVPRAAAEAFLDAQGDMEHKRLIVVEGVDHMEGWRARWPGLLAEPLK